MPGMIDPATARRLAGAMSLAAELAVTVTLSVLAGAWLDSRFGTSPILLLALALLGLVIGLVRLTRAVQQSWLSDDGEPPLDRS